MKNKELGIGRYEATSTLCTKWKINPVVIEKISLTDQVKAYVLEFLKESDDFHKLVCDITGTERKQVKVSPELEKLKEDYLDVCNRYKKEQEKSNNLLHKRNDELAKRMKAEADLRVSHSHFNNVMNKIKELLKEVDMPSVKSAIEALKSERINGKLFAEQCELLKTENDTLVKRCSEFELKFDRLSKSYNNVCNETKKIEKNRDNLSDNYDRLAKDYEYLNKNNQNQANTITKQMREILELRTELAEQEELVAKYRKKSESIQCKLDEELKQRSKFVEEIERLKKYYQIQTDLAQGYDKKCQRLQAKLNKASKRYGELIKIISDRAIKSI